jgi:hypothetical protein
MDPRFVGSNPAQYNRFLMAIKCAERLPWEGSKAVGPTSQAFRHVKESYRYEKSLFVSKNLAVISPSKFILIRY